MSCAVIPTMGVQHWDWEIPASELRGISEEEIRLKFERWLKEAGADATVMRVNRNGDLFWKKVVDGDVLFRQVRVFYTPV